jgi:transposase
METCTQSRAVARLGQAAGLEVVVVPGHVLRALGIGRRGQKTDKKDARLLATASLRSDELPGVFLRDDENQRHKELLATRDMLMAHRRSHALAIKAWFRGRLILVRGRAHTMAFLAAVERAAKMVPGGLPAHLQPHLDMYKALTGQIIAMDRSIATLVEQRDSCKRLMEIPGVGPVIALAFTSHLADPKRFPSAAEVASYLALVPGEATTGGRIVRTSTIKAGPQQLKALLIQGAWSLMRTRPNEPMVLWAKRIEGKGGEQRASGPRRRIAIVALARKLATVMWAVWRHESRYQPDLATQAPPTEAANLAA